MSFVERLPSRNKTFQSAQILTVSELRQQFLKRSIVSSSVRITGTLISHNIEGNFIRITDPLLSKSKTPNPYKKASNRDNSTLPKNRNSINPENTSKTSNQSFSKLSNTTHRNEMPIASANTPMTKSSSVSITNPYLRTPSVLKRKIRSTTPSLVNKSSRKIISIQKKRHTSILERSKKNATFVSQQKRYSSLSKSPSSFSTPLNTKLKQKKAIDFHNSIVVDISSVSITNTHIGDLVTIIGEMQFIRFSRFCIANNKCEDDIHDNSIAIRDWNIIHENDHAPLPARMSQAILQSAQNYVKDNGNTTKSEFSPSEDDDDDETHIPPESQLVNLPITQLQSTTHTSQNTIESESLLADKPEAVEIKKTGGFLAARILKSVNGTDMNLQYQALLLRRKYYNL